MVYPADFTQPPMPAADMLTLEKAVTSGTLSGPDDLRCSLSVTCWIASFYQPAAAGVAPRAALTNAEAAHYLHDLAAGPAVATRASIPWGPLWTILQALITAYLASHGG